MNAAARQDGDARQKLGATKLLHHGFDRLIAGKIDVLEVHIEEERRHLLDVLLVALLRALLQCADAYERAAPVLIEALDEAGDLGRLARDHMPLRAGAALIGE
ncbi:hypothetical protein [Bradyrhizobium sp. S3.2.12]|uniref:hypothetical protein n=1 Tax=Bradyrhizobium sp. S3.2.12 TaxID=3156387 RepID=UPI003397618C